jgi:hypothetical protein
MQWKEREREREREKKKTEREEERERTKKTHLFPNTIICVSMERKRIRKGERDIR